MTPLVRNPSYESEEFLDFCKKSEKCPRLDCNYGSLGHPVLLRRSYPCVLQVRTSGRLFPSGTDLDRVSPRWPRHLGRLPVKGSGIYILISPGEPSNVLGVYPRNWTTHCWVDHSFLFIFRDFDGKRDWFYHINFFYGVEPSMTVNWL